MYKYSLSTLLLCAFLLFSGCGDADSKGEKSNSTSQNNSTEEVATPETTNEVEEMTPEEVEEEAPVATNSRDGVIVHISQAVEDKFNLCLALSIAADMAADHDVLVYFDQRATVAAFADTPDFEYNPFPKYKEQISKLKAKGVKMRVCSSCLDAYFKKKSDLMSEIEVLKPIELTTFTEGKIVTLDY